MKKAFILSIALVFVIAWAIPAIASPYPDEVFVGKKIWNFNILWILVLPGRNQTVQNVIISFTD